MRIGRAVEGAVLVGLAAHVVMTVFHNTPDTKVNFSNVSPLLSGLPQWRFFAPNPGVDNTHLMVRTRRDGAWGTWRELRIPTRVPWYAVLWNPGNRAPKVLFDAAQQLQVLAGLGASYDAAVGTDAYRLLDDLVADSVGGDVEACQFMVVTNRPGSEPGTGMRPVLVSRERVVAGPG